MTVQARKGLVQSERSAAPVGMIAAVGVLRWVRARLFAMRRGRHTCPYAAVKASNVIGQGERERILAQARVHGLVAIQVGELAQANAGRREDLRRKLMGREDGNDLSAAWLRSRIEEVDRLITQQVATVDWHLRESGRLRERVADVGFPDAGPAARGRGVRSHRAGSTS
jgi:hypothetical protein